MGIYRRTKDPAENYVVLLDFTGQLPSGANIASATVVATKKSDGETDNSVTTTSATVTNTTVSVHVQAGTHGETYDLKVTVTLDDASPTTVFVEHLYLKVMNTSVVNL